MRKFVTIVIAIISITAGAFFIKAMLELEKEAANYLDERKGTSVKDSASEKNPDAETNTQEHPENDVSSENTNTLTDSRYKGSTFHKVLNNTDLPQELKDKPKLAANILYDELFFELGLSEEEINKFTDLITQSTVTDSENNGLDINNKNEKIKELIGELSYEVYEQYNNTLIHRTKIIQYKEQLNLANILLMDEQQSDLLDVMLQEGGETQLPYFSNDPEYIKQKIKEISDNFLQKRSESDIRILEKCSQFLDPEQIEVLKEFLDSSKSSDQLDLKKLSEAYNINNPSEN